MTLVEKKSVSPHSSPLNSPSKTMSAPLPKAERGQFETPNSFNLLSSLGEESPLVIHFPDNSYNTSDSASDSNDDSYLRNGKKVSKKTLKTYPNKPNPSKNIPTANTTRLSPAMQKSQTVSSSEVSEKIIQSPSSMPSKHYPNAIENDPLEGTSQSFHFTPDSQNTALTTAELNPKIATQNDGNAEFSFPRNSSRVTPIIVKDDRYTWKSLMLLLEQNNFNGFKAKLKGDNTFNITAAGEDMQRSITKLFDRIGVLYHSYTLPSDKNIKVVIKSLPKDTNVVDIQKALEMEGYIALNVVQLTKRLDGNKIDLPLFMVTLPRTEQSRGIYNLPYLFNLKINVESYRGRQGPTQCHRCQQYFHAQASCRHQARCVKCAGSHLSSECTKPFSEPPKCVLCEGEHTANWRGCPRRPTVQIRQPPTRTTRPTTNHQISNQNFPTMPANNHSNPPQPFESRVFVNRSYSQVASNIADIHTTTTQATAEYTNVLDRLTSLVDWVKNSGLVELLESLRNGSSSIQLNQLPSSYE